jgi:aspartate aminotransferase
MLMTQPLRSVTQPSCGEDSQIISPLPPYRRVFDELSPNAAAELLVYGKSKSGTISLAQGESDEPSPIYIREATASALLDRGMTHYGPVLGLPELRQEISDYQERVFGVRIPANRIFVTTSGTSAVHLALASIVEPGDEVVTVTPIWKNLIGITELTGAKIREVTMDCSENGWTLDLGKLFAACTPKTKAMMIVSPNNPTGWVMNEEDIKEVMAFARKRGIWVLADEVYARCMYGQNHAPSFLKIAEPEDRLFILNSFSKTWAMTGWRLGWIVGPAQAESKIMTLAQYETMGPPSFTQIGAIAGLKNGEEWVTGQLGRWESNLDLVMDRFAKTGRIQMVRPKATFYAFFKVEGEPDSVALVRRLIDEAGLSLAPGCSFGSNCGEFIRLCFAGSQDRLSEALNRLEMGLSK